MLEELKGYFKVYAFDCQTPEVAGSQRFKVICEKEDNHPFFQLLKPPEMKINPYTKKPMAPTGIQYNEREVTPQKFKNYVLANLPDFSVKLDSLKKVNEFTGAEDDKDTNRVILFSKKGKTPPVYKVLTSAFRDRIRFGFVSSDSADVVNEFGVTEFPTILALKSFEPSDN